MTKHVQSRACLDCGRHGSGVDGVANAECWFQVAVGDASLGSLRHEIKDGGSCGLAARPRGGWHCNERLEWPVDGSTLAQGCIDKVQKVGIGIGVVQIHEFGSVNDGTSAHSKKCVWGIRPDPFDGLLYTRPWSANKETPMK